MEIIEHRDPETGRLYKAIKDGEAVMIVGPLEGLVDSLDLPEPFATNLHNTLYHRGFITYEDVRRKPNQLFGALQEALNIDVQRLTEAFVNFEKEVQP